MIGRSLPAKRIEGHFVFNLIISADFKKAFLVKMVNPNEKDKSSKHAPLTDHTVCKQHVEVAEIVSLVSRHMSYSYYLHSQFQYKSVLHYRINISESSETIPGTTSSRSADIPGDSASVECLVRP
jgi:hypothetical protein